MISDDIARTFVRLGGPNAQLVRSAVHVGVDLPVIGIHSLYDRVRLLGTGRVVEVDERDAVHEARENREVGPDPLNVIGSVR